MTIETAQIDEVRESRVVNYGMKTREYYHVHLPDSDLKNKVNWLTDRHRCFKSKSAALKMANAMAAKGERVYVHRKRLIFKGYYWSGEFVERMEIAPPTP